MLPAIKWFSDHDMTTTFPEPITCYRVDKTVAGQDWKTWAGWLKLARYLAEL